MSKKHIEKDLHKHPNAFEKENRRLKRKIAEIRESEEKYRTIVENAFRSPPAEALCGQS